MTPTYDMEPPYLFRIYARGIRVVVMNWRTVIRLFFVPILTLVGVNVAKGMSGVPLTLLAALSPLHKTPPSQYDLGMIE
jgi:hypothetical protein